MATPTPTQLEDWLWEVINAQLDHSFATTEALVMLSSIVPDSRRAEYVATYERLNASQTKLLEVMQAIIQNAER
jgi:hypothetical protein